MSRLTTEEFIVKAKRIHGNKFSYTKTKYVNSETNLTIICPIHGDFSTKPFIHLYGSDCPKCAVIPGRPPKTNEERFWKLVKSGNPDECWEWQGSKNRGGYGRFNKYNHIHNTHIYAHKFSYELHNGPIPDELFVLHKCDNPSCVNPNHLFLGTRMDNAQDMKKKGRSALGDKNGSRKHPDKLKRGEDSPNAKITNELARRIYLDWINALDKNIPKLAQKYNTTNSIVRNIVNGKTWIHVTKKHSTDH